MVRDAGQAIYFMFPRDIRAPGDCYLPATRTVLRPAFLAANRAWSAAMSTVAASTPSAGAVETPAEMVKRPSG